ncbi:amphi-Trp domain-containing protein [Streptomyces sp. NPDC051940]|uniref:amphi-Trp domain-containing protein n=1 Tax=Streptomyces sp. NPDC051940 TaxID=3155675 RepID=UPI00343BC1E3
MDLKLERKRSLSRVEAADQLTALADALREGGDAELDLGPGTLSLRIPDSLESEVEIEIGDGEIELEIEFKWPTAAVRTPTSGKVVATDKPAARKSVTAKPGRGSAGTSRRKSTKQSAGKTP